MSEVKVQTEEVNDIPLLIKQQEKMGIAEILDQIVPQHGNRKGLSVGQMIVGWLSYILSESDHRLSFVEEWAAKQTNTLSHLLPGYIGSQDFTDDRLGDGLRVLSDDTVWEALESQLGKRLIRIYQLPTAVGRVDTTTVSLYHQADGSAIVAEGFSKDHRPDLAQLKVLLLALDPLAIPMVTMVVSGNRADDGLYLPAIEAARQTLPSTGMLYVGDSKMEALATRAGIVQSGNYYLVPLSQKGEQGELLTTRVAAVLDQKEKDLVSVYQLSSTNDAEPKLIAQGQETIREQSSFNGDELCQWSERLLLVYSPTLAQSGYRGLEKRLQKAAAKLLALTPEPGRGKKQYSELAPLQQAVEAIQKRYKVTGLLDVTFEKQVTHRHTRAYRDRPARTEQIVRFQLRVARREEAITEAFRQFGWRLYVTNAPVELLPLPDAVRVYRGGVPTIEHDFSRLKGRPLGLRPAFVHRDDHLNGLVRLLSLALRILTLTEFVVHRSLKENDETLTGLYPGNPTKETNKPTTERLLRAFKGITLSIIDLPGQHIQHVSPLSPLQRRILQLLRFDESIYSELADLQPILV
jgi:transposase